MTINELSKYHSAKIEIDQLENNIRELESTIIGASKITGMPIIKSNSTSNPTERIGIKLVRLKNKLEVKKELLIDVLNKIEDFLETVEDSEIRVIIRERFIDGKTWQEISRKIISDRSTPYYKLKKYLKERMLSDENKK